MTCDTRANAAAPGRAAISRAREFATARVRIAYVLHISLVDQPMDWHAASPWVPVCVLIVLGRRATGLVLCSIRGRVHVA